MRRSVILKILLGLIFISCQNRSSKVQKARILSKEYQNVDTVEEITHRGSVGLEESTFAEDISSVTINNNASSSRSHGAKALDTVSLSDFGAFGNGKDETSKIQLALNSAVGKTLIIPKQLDDHYLTGQLIIPSNINIQFERGVVFLADDNLKQDMRNAESLFRFESSENVVFEGNGAVLKMNKSNYSGEFNHLIMINGARNITVRNVIAKDSGGDGFYVGAAWTKRVASENIKLSNCVAYNNRRQGISVISVDGLFVENSEFSHTNGTLPEAGVCIEPSMPNYKLKKIHFKNCKTIGNKGRGFQVVLIKSGAKSEAIDITFENCKADGNDIGFSNRYFADGSTGSVKMINCVAENSRGPGFWEGSCSANGASKYYINCIAINNGVDLASATVKRASGFGISNFPKYKKKHLGNSTFDNCQTLDNQKMPTTEYGMDLIDDANFHNVLINNFKSKGHITKKIGINFRELSLKRVDVQNR